MSTAPTASASSRSDEPGDAHRRPQRLADHPRHRRRRESRRLRPVGAARAHPVGGLSRQRRDGDPDRADGYRVRTLTSRHVDKPINQIEWDLATIERGGFEHFMLKEIFEQPESVENTMRGHLLGRAATSGSTGSSWATNEVQKIRRIIITACGTSWHSALIGKYMIEELARIPTEVEYASEFRYRNPIVDEHTLVIAISQSGETADTLAALRGSQAARRAHRRPGQRGGIDHRPRGGRRAVPALRPRDRCRQHQGVHLPGDGAGDGHAPPRAGARDVASRWAASTSRR